MKWGRKIKNNKTKTSSIMALTYWKRFLSNGPRQGHTTSGFQLTREGFVTFFFPPRTKSRGQSSTQNNSTQRVFSTRLWGRSQSRSLFTEGKELDTRASAVNNLHGGYRAIIAVMVVMMTQVGEGRYDIVILADRNA